MTTKLVRDGNTIEVTATGNITKGMLYALGVTGTSQGINIPNGLPAVAAGSYTTGDSAVFLVEGVFQLSKIAEASSSIVIGQQVFWRTTGGVNELTGVLAAANGVAGCGMAAAVTGAETATVKLIGVNAFTAAT